MTFNSWTPLFMLSDCEDDEGLQLRFDCEGDYTGECCEILDRLCAEAELLSLIDSVDSRMEIYRETYETMEPGTFSPRIFALEKKIFRHE